MPSNASLADVYDSVRKQRQQQQSLAGGVNAPAGAPVAPVAPPTPAAAAPPGVSAITPPPPVPNQTPAELQTITPPSLQAITAAPGVQKSTGFAPDGRPVTSYSQVGNGMVTLADVQRDLPNSRGSLSVAGVTPDEMAYRNQVVSGINQATASLRRGRLENRAERTDAIGAAARNELARMDARDQSLGDLQAKQDANQVGLAAALAKANPYQETLAREQAKNDAKRAVEQTGAQQNASDLFNKLDRLESLSGVSGFFSPALAYGSKVFGGDRAAKSEEFTSVANNLVASLVKQLPGQLSERELAFLQAQIPKLGNTEEGNRRIIQSLRDFTTQKLQAAGLQLPNAAGTGAASPADRINTRGAELMQQGMTQDQVLAKLREEFSGAY